MAQVPRTNRRLAAPPRPAGSRGELARSAGARLLAAATCTLALLFTQPACFTMMTWQDDRTRDTVARVEPPALRAVLVRDHAEGRAAGSLRLVLQVPDVVRAPMGSLAPAPTPSAEWVEVEPLEHADTIAAVLARSIEQERWRTWLTLDVVEDPPAAPRLRLRSWASPSPPSEAGRLRGYRLRPGLIASYELDVPCRLLPHAGPPPGAAADEPRTFAVQHVRYHDNGMPLVVRIVLTPFAVAGDVLLSPFELLWWFSV